MPDIYALSRSQLYASGIADLEPTDGDQFDEISGWSGEYKHMTSKAILLVVRGADIWLPLSHLRIEATGEIYASTWIMKEKQIE